MSNQTSPHHEADRFLERDGARLRWRLTGSGPAIALLHGWALDLEYWDPLIAPLAPHFTLLRFDRCGFGLSAGLPDIHRNVGDLAALLDAAEIERAAVLGMSQGARLAIHFALQRPERTRALLLDGAPALEAESELPITQYRAVLDLQGVTALQAEILRHPLMRLQTHDPATEQRLARIVGRYRGRDLQYPRTPARPPDPAAVTAPALLLTGQLDSAARRAGARRLQQMIPNAQHIELPDAGHLALLDDPIGYAAAIKAFCSQLPP